MESFFAPAPRADQAQLALELNFISNNPVIDAVMRTVQGLLAVLNEQRQILSINDQLLEFLGINDADKAFGLRPGEALNCAYANEMPAGCGTSPYCVTCGAAIAMVVCLESNQAQERECALTPSCNNDHKELCFRVRAVPIKFDDRRYILLFLQDISQAKQNAALEHTFFHDINNIIAGLVGTTELLDLEEEKEHPKLLKRIQNMGMRLAHEVAIQKAISNGSYDDYAAMPQKTSVIEIFNELQEIFSNHPAAKDKILTLDLTEPQAVVVTEPSLLIRILTNMVTNALEASKIHEEIKVWINQKEASITFSVWNQTSIPNDMARRIFQKYYSTKKGDRRGLGTYSMKLLGEKYLGGRVEFVSTLETGTVFSLILPK
jgi:signal transduction histidine kinase